MAILRRAFVAASIAWAVLLPLVKVNLADAELADQTFDELMGTEVEGRKRWIAANARKAELDV